MQDTHLRETQFSTTTASAPPRPAPNSHLATAQLCQPVPPLRRLQLFLKRSPLLLQLLQLAMGLRQLALVLAAQRSSGLVPKLGCRACSRAENWLVGKQNRM